MKIIKEEVVIGKIRTILTMERTEGDGPTRWTLRANYGAGVKEVKGVFFVKAEAYREMERLMQEIA